MNGLKDTIVVKHGAWHKLAIVMLVLAVALPITLMAPAGISANQGMVINGTVLGCGQPVSGVAIVCDKAGSDCNNAGRATINLDGTYSIHVQWGGPGAATIKIVYSAPGYASVTRTFTGVTNGAELSSEDVNLDSTTAPAAVGDSATVSVGSGANTINVLANDSGLNLTVIGVGPASKGTAAASSDGKSVTYTPAAGQTGSDSFTYTIRDACGKEATATVDVTITAVNRAPVANDQAVTTNQDTPVAITLTGSDADGDTLTFTVLTNPAHGMLSGTAPNLTYTPTAGYSGPDSFTFKVNDGTVDSAIATVSVTVSEVLPENTPPVADNQSVTTNQDTPVAITLTGSDADGDTLTFTVLTNPAHGTLSGMAPTLTYTPTAGYSGPDSFTFKVNDGTVDSAIATVSITVSEVLPENTPPVADNQSVTTNHGTPVAITLSGSDADGDTLTFTVLTNPAHGTLSGTAPNLTYTPTAGYSGPDSFTFKVNDGTVDSAIATVTITVKKAPEEPTPPPPAPEPTDEPTAPAPLPPATGETSPEPVILLPVTGGEPALTFWQQLALRFNGLLSALRLR